MPEPAWKTLLPAPAEDLTSPTPTRLGLMFELREQTPRTATRWQGPVARTATADTAIPATTRLAVRPVTLSAAGRWIRGSLTWSNIAFQSHRMALDPRQQRWFGAFSAVHRSTRELAASVDADWLTLDEFHSPVLWALWAEASDLGIALVSSQDGTVVTVGLHAVVSVDLSRGDAATGDADLLLRCAVAIGDREFSAEGVGTISDHGVYAYSWVPEPVIQLAPTRLTAAGRRLLARPHTTVPAADVDEFFSGYYPRLARSATVTSRDSSIDLPEPSPGVLVLTATFAPAHRLRLDWHWDYDGERMPISSAAERASAHRGQGSLRDDAREHRIEAAVVEILGAEILGADRVLDTQNLDGVAAAEFSAITIPRLERSEGVRVGTRGNRPDYRELTAVPTLTVTTVDTDHRDWFDLGVLVTVDGRTVPFGPLFAALATGRKKLLLVDNSYLHLDHPAFEELLRLIREATGLTEWETGPRISRYNQALWSEFEDLADETVEAESWRRSARALREIDGVPAVPLPAGLMAELRPYQQQGLDWLVLLYRHELGGILADDMGLGKTVQALALVAHAIETNPHTRPFLVVAPTSVVPGWVSEAERFLPGADVLEITATEKKSGHPLAETIAGARIVVTSYALFRLDFEAYDGIEWAALILDEAQFTKNPASQAHRCAVELRAPAKFALTGTPLENSLVDVWSMCAIVAPGLFPSARRFTEHFLRPSTQRESAEVAAARIAELRRRIRPIVLRRTKQLVAAELPPKQEQTIEVHLPPAHREIYDTYLQRERQKLLGLIQDLDRNRFIVFRSLTLLRMLALDASLIDPAYATLPSAKLDALMEHLEAVVAEGHRALVFSQFTSFLRLAADRLDAAGIAYAYLDGSTRQRAAVISGFRTGIEPVFLISLKAGGFGLNLIEADYVFLLDPWWNPAAENQAIDRTHRIGQTRPVNVYRLVATATIEGKVMALRDRKARLFDAVMDDDGVFSDALTADDIRGLLDD